MTRTPDDQRSDMENPNSGDQKDVPDERSRLIKEATESVDKEQGGSGDPQVSIPSDMPKE